MTGRTGCSPIILCQPAAGHAGASSRREKFSGKVLGFEVMQHGFSHVLIIADAWRDGDKPSRLNPFGN